MLNPFNLQEAQDDKLSIPNIKARDQSGRNFNVDLSGPVGAGKRAKPLRPPRAVAGTMHAGASEIAAIAG